MERSMEKSSYPADYPSIFKDNIMREYLKVPIVYAKYGSGTLIIATPFFYKSGKRINIFINNVDPEMVWIDFGCGIDTKGFLELDRDAEYFVGVLVYKDNKSHNNDYPFTLKANYNEAGFKVAKEYKNKHLLRDMQRTMEDY